SSDLFSERPACYRVVFFKIGKGRIVKFKLIKSDGPDYFWFACIPWLFRLKIAEEEIVVGNGLVQMSSKTHHCSVNFQIIKRNKMPAVVKNLELCLYAVDVKKGVILLVGNKSIVYFKGSGEVKIDGFHAYPRIKFFGKQGTHLAHQHFLHCPALKRQSEGNDQKQQAQARYQ